MCLLIVNIFWQSSEWPSICLKIMVRMASQLLMIITFCSILDLPGHLPHNNKQTNMLVSEKINDLIIIWLLKLFSVFYATKRFSTCHVIITRVRRQALIGLKERSLQRSLE